MDAHECCYFVCPLYSHAAPQRAVSVSEPLSVGSFESSVACCITESSFWSVLGFSITEYTLGPPQLRALEPCIDAAVRGLQLSITAQSGEANDGWRLGQLHRRAGLQPRQMKSSSLCVSHILLAVPERNGSLQTKTNKLDIWIWTLDFNHFMAACVQVAGHFKTDTWWKQGTRHTQ